MRPYRRLEVRAALYGDRGDCRCPRDADAGLRTMRRDVCLGECFVVCEGVPTPAQLLLSWAPPGFANRKCRRSGASGRRQVTAAREHVPTRSSRLSKTEEGHVFDSFVAPAWPPPAAAPSPPLALRRCCLVAPRRCFTTTSRCPPPTVCCLAVGAAAAAPQVLLASRVPRRQERWTFSRAGTHIAKHKPSAVLSSRIIKETCQSGLATRLRLIMPVAQRRSLRDLCCS